MRARRSAGLALAALLLLGVAPLPAASGESLPEGVVARVWGRNITEAQLLERLARRHEATERGRAVLDQLVDDACVAQEAARRGVSVTGEEVAAYVKKVDETIRKSTGGDRSIEDVYREQRTNEAEFRRIAREYLVRQRMAAEDLGAKPGEELPEHRLKLWLSALRKRLAVRTTGLPDGVLAAIGETTIDRQALARALRERLPKDLVNALRDDLVLEAAVAHSLAEANVEVTDADVDAEIDVLRRRFADDPRVRGTGATFDDFLRQTRAMSAGDLRADANFRARTGLQKLLGRDIRDEAIRQHWEANRDAYGERALVRQVYVPAAEEGGKFEMRSFRDAYERAFQAKVAVLEGTGRLGGDGAAGSRPLGDVLTAVAKQYEDDPQKRAAAGEPVAWTRANLAGEPKLAEAVFQGELGALVGPVRSSVGWHLLVVEERRAAPAFEEVRAAVREDLLREAMRKYQLALRLDPNVVLAD